MKTLALLVLAATLAVFARSAQQPTLSETQDLKPPSELALLMRDMTTFTDSTRLHVQRGADMLPYPEDFKRMHTATATDDHLDRATFTAFANNYLEQLAALYKAAPEDRTRLFNAMVNACANCHQNVCPGPMVRIKKLYVPL